MGERRRRSLGVILRADPRIGKLLGVVVEGEWLCHVRDRRHADLRVVPERSTW